MAKARKKEEQQSEDLSTKYVPDPKLLEEINKLQKFKNLKINDLNSLPKPIKNSNNILLDAIRPEHTPTPLPKVSVGSPTNHPIKEDEKKQETQSKNKDSFSYGWFILGLVIIGLIIANLNSYLVGLLGALKWILAWLVVGGIVLVFSSNK